MLTDPNLQAADRVRTSEPILDGFARAADALGGGEVGRAGPSLGSTDAIAVRWNRDLGTVSPNAGIFRPSQTVMRIEDTGGAGITHATLAEAGRQGLRFGVYSPAVVPRGGLCPPFTLEDAEVHPGDSAIVATYGLGGAIAYAAPEMARTWGEPQYAGRAMRRLFLARHPTIAPALADEAGGGLGLDARAVVAQNRAVRFSTGIAHRNGETGWIGVGVAEPSAGCFAAAGAALARAA